MKIAHINKFYPPTVGGIEYHVRMLTQELSKMSHIENIDILVANEKRQRVVEIINAKTKIIRLPSWLTAYSTPIAPAFITEISKIQADMFHFHFPYPFGDFAWLLSGDKRPYCITYHSDILRQKVLEKFYRPLMYRFFDKASAIITTSPHLIDSSPVLQKYHKKVYVVALGIDPQPFTSLSASMKAMEIKSRFSDKPVVLFVGRLVYYKGVDVLVKAFKNIDAHLLLIGKGPLEMDLKQTAAELNITDKIHFVSNVSDEMMPAYFNASDIFVLPSVANTEAYGLVQLEAHASGKPVISTNLPTGVPFVNQHGVTGLIVPPGEIGPLAGALAELVHNEQLRITLGRQAKARMLEQFTSATMAQKVLDIYHTIA